MVYFTLEFQKLAFNKRQFKKYLLRYCLLLFTLVIYFLWGLMKKSIYLGESFFLCPSFCFCFCFFLSFCKLSLPQNVTLPWFCIKVIIIVSIISNIFSTVIPKILSYLSLTKTNLQLPHKIPIIIVITILSMLLMYYIGVVIRMFFVLYSFRSKMRDYSN